MGKVGLDCDVKWSAYSPSLACVRVFRALIFLSPKLWTTTSLKLSGTNYLAPKDTVHKMKWAHA